MQQKQFWLLRRYLRCQVPQYSTLLLLHCSSLAKVCWTSHRCTLTRICRRFPGVSPHRNFQWIRPVAQFHIFSIEPLFVALVIPRPGLSELSLSGSSKDNNGRNCRTVFHLDFNCEMFSFLHPFSFSSWDETFLPSLCTCPILLLR